MAKRRVRGHTITLTALPPGAGVAAKKDGEETPGSAPLSTPVNSIGPRETLRTRGEQTQWRYAAFP